MVVFFCDLMHQLFDSNKVDFDKFFVYKKGGSDFYIGRPYIRSYRQQGQGVGLVLSSLWRFIAPVLKNLGSNLGKEALSTGSRFLEGAANGENLKELAKKEFKQATKNIVGSKQKGEGRKRKLIGRRYLTKKQKDIFG